MVSLETVKIATSHARQTIQDPHASQYDKRQFNDGWFVETMPDLNQRQPLLSTYLIQNAIWWIEYANLSGIRVDTYSYSDKAFLADWTKAIMTEYPNFNIVGEEWTTKFVLSVLIVATLAVLNILRSPLGRAMIAVRDSEVSSQALGVNPMKIKVFAFTVSAAITGFGGRLFGALYVVSDTANIRNFIIHPAITDDCIRRSWHRPWCIFRGCIDWRSGNRHIDCERRPAIFDWRLARNRAIHFWGHTDQRDCFRADRHLRPLGQDPQLYGILPRL